MFFIFSFFTYLTQSYTWYELSIYGTSNKFEQTKFDYLPEIKEHSSKDPIIYEKQTMTAPIKVDTPFLGIVDSTFEDIDCNNDFAISLTYAQIQVQNTVFSNIQNGYALNLNSCYMSTIESSTFKDFNDAGAINLLYCDDITIKESIFEGFKCDGLNISCIVVSTSQFILFDVVKFTTNNMTSSPLVVSNTQNITVNNALFQENYIITPGQIFVTNSINFVIQNSVFNNNTCASHSCAILSLYNHIIIAQCLFQQNMVLQLESNIPDTVKQLPFYQAASAVTIIESTTVVTDKQATTFKNLYFNANSPLLDIYTSYIYIQAIDFFYQGPNPKIIGTIESTGNDDFQICSSSYMDQSLFKLGVEKLSWSSEVLEPLNFTVDYKYQPFLPSVRGMSISSYAIDPPIYASAPYSYISIENCNFENSYVQSSYGDDDTTSFIHIDLKNKGYVSLLSTTFTNNKVTSSLVEVLHTKGISIVDCEFSRNTAKYTSGLLLVDAGTIRLCHTEFEKNNAYTHAACAIYNSSDALIINCKFRKNAGFIGTSSLIVEGTNLKLNGTIFTRNVIDVEESSLPKDYIAYNHSLLIYPHKAIPGITYFDTISATFSAYKKSHISMNNVVFSDNEDESGLDSPLFNLTGYDGYADDSVTFDVTWACTDTKRFNFNYNWSSNLVFDYRNCDLLKQYDYREIIVPNTENEETVYVLEKQGSGYVTKETTVKGIIYSPSGDINMTTDLKRVIPPPAPTPIPAEIVSEGLAPYKTILISVGAVCFVVCVVGCVLIYKYRKKPENRLKKKTPEQKAVMDGLMNNKEGYGAQDDIDEPPTV